MLSNNAIDTNSDIVVSSVCGSDVDFLIAVSTFPTFDGAGTWPGESLRLHTIPELQVSCLYANCVLESNFSKLT